MRFAKKKLGFPQENILVVNRDALITSQGASGIIPVDEEAMFETISTKGLFIDRNAAETNENYKQIIPYLIYQYKKSFFLMQRSGAAAEKRLRECYTLGIGGHVRERDLQDSHSILDWAQREFAEEVVFSGNYQPLFLGLLNDDSNAVGRVHLGLVFLLRGDSPNITIRSEHKNGKLVSFEELLLFKEELESWSKIVVDYLVYRKTKAQAVQSTGYF